jgi:hypothetical protein
MTADYGRTVSVVLCIFMARFTYSFDELLGMRLAQSAKPTSEIFHT